MPNLTVHHLQVGQGERIPWLLEELSIPYTLKNYQRAPYFSPPELAALTDMGASPVLEDFTSNSEQPLKLAESGAVTEYIIHKYGNGKLALPPSHQDYADYLYWFHFANSTLQPTVFRTMQARALAQSIDEPRLKFSIARLARTLKHMDDRLSSNPWLAGQEFTAADIMSVFSLTTMRKFEPIDLGQYEGILGWLKKCTEREGYRKAIEKSDPESLAELEALISANGPAKFVPK